MSNFSFNIEPLDSCLLEEAIELFRSNGIVKRYDQEQFYYKDQYSKAVTIRESGVLIGFNATMPAILDNNNQALWSCDFIIDKKYRSFGLGTKIKKFMLESFDCPIYCLGVSPIAQKVLKKCGWLEAKGPKQYQKIIHPTSIKGFLFFLVGKMYQFSKIKIYTKTLSNSPISFHISEELPHLKEFRGFFPVSGSEGTLKIARSYDYLKWRYSGADKPYKYLSVKVNSKVNALVIYKTLNNKIDMVDFVYSKGGEYLLTLSFEYLEKYYYANMIDCLISEAFFDEILKSNGFIKKRYAPSFLYFNPNKEVHNKFY